MHEDLAHLDIAFPDDGTRRVQKTGKIIFDFYQGVFTDVDGTTTALSVPLKDTRHNYVQSLAIFSTLPQKMVINQRQNKMFLTSGWTVFNREKVQILELESGDVQTPDESSFQILASTAPNAPYDFRGDKIYENRQRLNIVTTDAFVTMMERLTLDYKEKTFITRNTGLNTIDVEVQGRNGPIASYVTLTLPGAVKFLPIGAGADLVINISDFFSGLRIRARANTPGSQGIWNGEFGGQG